MCAGHLQPYNWQLGTQQHIASCLSRRQAMCCRAGCQLLHASLSGVQAAQAYDKAAIQIRGERVLCAAQSRDGSFHGRMSAVRAVLPALFRPEVHSTH